MDWDKFVGSTLWVPELSFMLDGSRMNLTEDFLTSMEPKMQDALAAMKELEGGAIANPDENRMVGHYWLRNPDLAPSADLTEAIGKTRDDIENLVARVHAGELQGADGDFQHLLVIGIGGSALGPQFVSKALGHPDRDRMNVHFFDNTDPDGIHRVLRELEGELGHTLAIVISKSGGTPETRNGMIEAEKAWHDAGLTFGNHAIAITGEGSKLDQHAETARWLARFPMWDWVGGRTSETGPVGLLPAALQGIDIGKFLQGAAAMDVVTRGLETRCNPAAMLALMWYQATNGKGEKDMVILPYKDRLELFSKYLQQLVMESLGKEKDLQGNTVHQGIAVYGNKGSTDQHAYVQQLREGVPNFFATFIEVLHDGEGEAVEVEDGVTPGDYLQGFLLGTREALGENGRASLTITIAEVTPFTVGMLIALYERAVGLYAHLVGINAYHQPGVEAGKKAAGSILALKQHLQAALREQSEPKTARELAEFVGKPDQAVTIFKLLQHLSANPAKKVAIEPASDYFASKFRAVS